MSCSTNLSSLAVWWDLLLSFHKSVCWLDFIKRRGRWRGRIKVWVRLTCDSSRLFIPPNSPLMSSSSTPPILTLPPVICSSFFSLIGEADLRAPKFLHSRGSESKHRVLLLPGRHFKQRHWSFHQWTGAEDVTSQYVSIRLGSLTHTHQKMMILFCLNFTHNSCKYPVLYKHSS